MCQWKSLVEPHRESKCPTRANSERRIIVSVIAEQAQETVEWRSTDVGTIEQLGSASPEQSVSHGTVAGHWLARFVHDDQMAMRHVALFVRDQRVGELLQTIGCHTVIARRDVDELPSRPTDARVPVRVQAMPWSLSDRHPRILTGEPLEELPRAVLRVIVADDQFPIRQRLTQDGVDSLLQKRQVVEIGQADGDQRAGHALTVHPSAISEKISSSDFV